MNTAKVVDNLIQDWKAAGITGAELVVAIAKACMGWPYVFGARGQYCTPSNRKARIRSDHPTIYTKCQVLTGPKTTCTGCRYYPGGTTRFFDCRGFTYWVFQQLGYKIAGAGATSQYNDNANWSEKGLIADMPRDVVCIVFKDVKGTKEHTGIHIGNGQIIHCSNGVQTGKITDKGWTHYALVNGFDGKLKTDAEVVEISGTAGSSGKNTDTSGTANESGKNTDISGTSGSSGKTSGAFGSSEDRYTSLPTVRNGSKGEAVVLCQQALMAAGYSVGPDGADGVFGKNTLMGVRDFQMDAGLTIDGIVGPSTWYAMQATVPAVFAHSDSSGSAHDSSPDSSGTSDHAPVSPVSSGTSDHAPVSPVSSGTSDHTPISPVSSEPSGSVTAASLYTVRIPHLTESAADMLLRQYPEAKKTKEGGES